MRIVERIPILLMEIETTAKARRKRKRRERRKVSLLPAELESLKCSKAEWEVRNISDILATNRSRKFCEVEQIKLLQKGLLASSLEALLSDQCVQVLVRVKIRVLRDLENIIARTIVNLRRIRFRRVLNDSAPKYLHKKVDHLIRNPLKRSQLVALARGLFTNLFRNCELLDPTNMDCLCANIGSAFSDLRKRGPLMMRNELWKGIRFNRIRWLDGIPFLLKEVVMLNCLKYLSNIFTDFVRLFFYTTVNFAGKIVHYRMDVWRRICVESFDLLRAERKLRLLTPDSGESSQHSTINHVHCLRFMPKKSNVRPIVMLRNPQVKKLLAETGSVLRFLMRQKPALYGWGISGVRLFQFAYRRFVLRHLRGENSDKQVQFCTADFRNCFTSLEHRFIERILHQIIQPQSQFIVAKVSVTNNVHKYKYVKIEASTTRGEALSRLRCRRTEQFVSNPLIISISGEELIERIRQFAMRTVIREPIYARGLHCERTPRLFIGGQGIAQGNLISVSLCNLYLGAMERELFPEYPRAVFCRRYVDDYIMLTYQKEQIEQLVGRMLGSMEGYGLRFGKIVTSIWNSSFGSNNRRQVRTLRRKEKIQWCGLAMNTRTLSMTMDYHRYRSRQPTFTFARTLHQSRYFRAISEATKKVLKGRWDALHACARVWPAKRRLALKRHFCKFAYEYYVVHFVRQLAINPKDKCTKSFLKQLMRWIFNNFSQRSLPSCFSEFL